MPNSQAMVYHVRWPNHILWQEKRYKFVAQFSSGNCFRSVFFPSAICCRICCPRTTYGYGNQGWTTQRCPLRSASGDDARVAEAALQPPKEMAGTIKATRNLAIKQPKLSMVNFIYSLTEWRDTFELLLAINLGQSGMGKAGNSIHEVALMIKHSLLSWLSAVWLFCFYWRRKNLHFDKLKRLGCLIAAKTTKWKLNGILNEI